MNKTRKVYKLCPTCEGAGIIVTRHRLTPMLSIVYGCSTICGECSGLGRLKTDYFTLWEHAYTRPR